MGLSLRILQIDVPSRDLDRAVAFWAAALAANPVDAPGDFVHLVGASSAVEVHLQAIGSAVPRYHLDLEASDRDAEAVRLIDGGAWELDRFDEGYTVLADPAGLPLCVIDAGSAAPTPVKPRRADGVYLSGIFVDVPEPLVDAEVAFWSYALDAEVVPTERPATYTALAGVQGPGGAVLFEIQKVGPTTVPRHHVDLEANDVAAEAARLEGLGARRTSEGDGWVVLADPVGNPFCLVPVPQPDER